MRAREDIEVKGCVFMKPPRVKTSGTVVALLLHYYKYIFYMYR